MSRSLVLALLGVHIGLGGAAAAFCWATAPSHRDVVVGIGVLKDGQIGLMNEISCVLHRRGSAHHRPHPHRLHRRTHRHPRPTCRIGVPFR